LLLLALEAYRLERGELPQSLDDLVGPYFDALPRDPYSGYAFSYFPAGLPAPATPLEAAQLEKGAWRSTSIVPGKPCIWCTGARLLVRDLNLGEPRNEPPEPAEKPKPVLYYTSREHGENWQPLLPYEAWTQGYWFPILNARR